MRSNRTIAFILYAVLLVTLSSGNINTAKSHNVASALPGNRLLLIPAPASVLSPVVGPVKVTSSNLGIRDGKWEFDQHKGGLHHAGGGIGGSNDTYAWDANWYTSTNSNADAGQNVYATAEGDVVRYAGVGLPNDCNAVLIAHPNKDAPQWWSGYLHLASYTVSIGQHVTQDTVIGKVGSSCANNDHLHFVVYTGQNVAGGLVSFNTSIVERSSATSCSNGSSVSYRNINGGPPVHPNGTLVWDDGRTVWLLRDGQKRWVVSENVLRNLYQQNGGFDFTDVITVASDELALYPRGDDVTGPLPWNGKSKPDGRLIKDPNGEISIVTNNGQRRGFITSDAFLGLGYSPSFCKAQPDPNYSSYTQGPAVEAMTLVTSSLNISPGPPYSTNSTINGSFRITNVGRTAVSLNHLLIGGRLSGQISDFDTDRPTTLSPGQSFNYTGTKLLSSAGTYDFFVAYQDVGGFWTTTVPTSSGVSATASISVNTPASCPSVGGINPTNGAVGSNVTISGSNFSGVTSVRFSGNVTASASVNSNTQITATVPSGAVSGPITLIKSGCSDAQTSSFTVTPPTRTLTVASSLPSSGVSISVSPSDNSGQGSGVTQFSRTYNNNTTVNLTAPSTAGGNNFQKWQRNSQDFSTNQSISVTMDANQTLTAVYTTPQDTTSPAVTITSPTTASNYDTNTTPITLSGTASDNTGVSQVTWANDRGGSGTASGTNSWTVNGINLQSGLNVLTVSARDSSGNVGTDVISINYTTTPTDTTSPSLVISSPSDGQTVTTSSITVTGTSSDAGFGNNGISSVTVNGVRASGDIASGTGTANWSQSVALSSGANTITVIATDNSVNHNSTNKVVTINYQPSNPVPPQSQWLSLEGGGTDIVVGKNLDGRLEIFVRGFDDALYHKSQLAPNSSTWSGWDTLGGGIDKLAVANNADGRLEVFVRGNDGALWHRAQVAPNSSNWSGWSSLGGGFDQLCVGSNADGRIQVFVRGLDKVLYSRAQAAPNSDSWSTWSSLGGGVNEAFVASNLDGRLEVFVRGNDNAIYHKWQLAPNSDSWTGWDTLGGGIDIFSIGRNADGRLELFARGTDQALYHRHQTSPGSINWSAWASLSAGIDDLAIGKNSAGGLEVFVRGKDGAPYHAWQTNPNVDNWSAWFGLGGTIDKLVVGQNASGNPEVFVRGLDKLLYHMTVLPQTPSRGGL